MLTSSERIDSAILVDSAILDLIRLPTYLVGGDANILYCNSNGRTALREEAYFRSASGTLVALHPTENARLKSAIITVCRIGECQTMLISEPRQLNPHLVRIVPYLEDKPTEKTRAVVFVQKSNPPADVFISSLRQMFRLSAAEMDIATALVLGEDIAHIAEQRHSKITTVRTQIAAMLLKTRTRRQGEMIALFSRICSLP